MNKRKFSQRVAVILCFMLVLIAYPASTNAQVGTSFTYQGQLQDSGSMVTGSYDFQFTLYDAQTNGSVQGSAINQTLTVSKGYFSTELDFGSSIFDGTSYWLEIAVRPNGGGAYTTLTQRQALTPSPYAIFAATIADASVTTASIADAAVTPIKLSTTGANSGDVLMYNGTTILWGPTSVDTTGATTNQVLTYDGTSAVWANPQGGGSQPTLAFSNNAGSIAVFPPLSTEVNVASVTQSVVAGQDAKIDYSLEPSLSTTSNWSISYEVRLYRDGTLINTKTIAESGSVAGTHTHSVAGTFVDTAPSSTSSQTYDLRVIVTSATNITSASAENRNLNTILF